MKDKKEVVKASPAIQIENKPNLLQRRAWNLLLAHSYDELLTSRKHSIPVKELVEALEFTSKNEAYLRKALEALVSCTIKWNILDKDNKQEWGVSALLASAVIKDGICTFGFSPHLAEKLFNPSIYARINLSIQNKFSSKYSLALYELFVDYLKIGETPFIPIEKFRNLMGVGEKDYFKVFRRLSERVVKPALKEINEVSDLEASVEYKRQGRGGKVVAVKFRMRQKPKKQLPKLKLDTKKTLTGLAKELYDRGIKPKSAAIELADKYPEERVQDAINAYDAGEIKTPGGIRRFLQDWWELTEKQQERVENVESIKEQETLEKQAEAIKMQRTVKALDNFVSKEEWIASVIKRSEAARSVMVRQNLATSELSEQELEEIRQTAAKDYPETKEAKLEHINRNKSDFGIDTDEIVKELKQEK